MLTWLLKYNVCSVRAANSSGRERYTDKYVWASLKATTDKCISWFLAIIEITPSQNIFRTFTKWLWSSCVLNVVILFLAEGNSLMWN